MRKRFSRSLEMGLCFGSPSENRRKRSHQALISPFYGDQWQPGRHRSQPQSGDQWQPGRPPGTNLNIEQLETVLLNVIRRLSTRYMTIGSLDQVGIQVVPTTKSFRKPTTSVRIFSSRIDPTLQSGLPVDLAILPRWTQTIVEYQQQMGAGIPISLVLKKMSHEDQEPELRLLSRFIVEAVSYNPSNDLVNPYRSLDR